MIAFYFSRRLNAIFVPRHFKVIFLLFLRNRCTFRKRSVSAAIAAVLQEEGQPMAAIPHLVGILCGHVYHFFTVVHPLMGAKRRVGAPGWMKRRLDGGDNPNFMDTPGDG